MSKFVPLPNFDSLSPQTTKGDLVGRTTVGATRVPVGSDNTVLTADSSNALGVSYKSVASLNNLSVATLSGATTLPASSQMLLISGSTFAITLPSPTSNSGLYYEFLKTDAETSAQSITGTGFVGVTMATKLERFKIVCDGTTYWISNHFAKTNWSNAVGSCLIMTTGVKGTSLFIDSVQWRRDGRFAEVNFHFFTGNAGTGAADQIRFAMPSPQLAIDTTVSGTNGVTNALNGAGSTGGGNVACWGGFNQSDTTAQSIGTCCVWSASLVRFWSYIVGVQQGFWGTGIFNLNNSSLKIDVTFRVPISGWSD